MDERQEVWMRMVEKTLGEINTKLDNALKGIDDHEVRLRAIECKPAKRWDSLVGQFIAAGIGWLAGYFLTK